MAEVAPTETAWIAAHPYLEPLARIHAEIDAALSATALEMVDLPRWDNYRDDYTAGIPLLRSSSVALDLVPAGRTIAGLVERLASGPAREWLAGVEALRTEIRGRDVPAWLLGDDAFQPSSPGLLRFLGWTATARSLRPVAHAFAGWRDEDRWLRRYCPACGSLPAMGRLLVGESGRQRLLCCGCCGSCWRYRRTACPFCEADTERAPVVTVEGEAGLRLDCCDSCRAYLKTYDGPGDAAILLADWTSLHLDVLAQERGLTRAAVSLYDLTPHEQRRRA